MDNRFLEVKRANASTAARIAELFATADQPHPPLSASLATAALHTPVPVPVGAVVAQDSATSLPWQQLGLEMPAGGPEWLVGAGCWGDAGVGASVLVGCRLLLPGLEMARWPLPVLGHPQP